MLNSDGVMMPAFNKIAANELSSHISSQTATDSLKLTEIYSSISNIDNNNSLFSSSQHPSDYGKHGADNESVNEPLPAIDSSIPSDLLFIPPKTTSALESPENLKENSSNDDEVVETPEKNQKQIEAEHFYAIPIPAPESQNLILAKSTSIEDTQTPIIFIQAEMCLVTPPPVRVQPFEAFIFKIPQSIHYEFLHRFNIECTPRRLIVGIRISNAAIINCQKQMSLQKMLKLNEKTVHRVTLYGECPRSQLQLKCTNWKGVQILLEVVKIFTQNSGIPEPSAASIIGRVLYHFFVKTSKFTNVHIHNGQSDGRVLNTAYSLRSNKKRDHRLAVDSFCLDNSNYDSKRLKKN